jgi:hypothetical protein
VLVELSCGHAVTLDLPPEIDPGPGYTLHCYECGHAVQVVSLTPQAEAAAEAAFTPILTHRPVEDPASLSPRDGEGDL